MKKYIRTLSIAFCAFPLCLLTSCDEEKALSLFPKSGEEATATPQTENPGEAKRLADLETQADSERDLRHQAEERADMAARKQGHMQLVAAVLAVICSVAFITGTAIGSRGREHATSA